MPQRREQEKSQLKELNDTEATKIPDAGFKTMVIKMLKDLKGRVNDLSDNLNKEITH